MLLLSLIVWEIPGVLGTLCQEKKGGGEGEHLSERESERVRERN